MSVKVIFEKTSKKLQLPMESKRPAFFYDNKILLVCYCLTDSTLANQLSPGWTECGPLTGVMPARESATTPHRHRLTPQAGNKIFLFFVLFFFAGVVRHLGSR